MGKIQSIRAKRPSRSELRRAAEDNSQLATSEHFHHLTAVRSEAKHRTTFECKTVNQGHYLSALESKRIVFCVGDAGVGKTFIAACQAAKLLIAKRISRIIVMRPAVAAEEELGFLPGELEEKLEPFFVPFRDVFEEWFGHTHLDLLIKNKDIQMVSIGHARGRTFNNAFVILDEAQNATKKQLKLVLTRLGRGSTMAINGDVTQVDIEEHKSCLKDALLRFRDLPDSLICEFDPQDSVRDPLIKEILKCYKHE
jgi:phosphate starvation-inducible PhoH-like protein